MSASPGEVTTEKLAMCDPLFKGCTRPAMLFGVPLKPLIGVSAPLFLSGMWGLFLAQAVGLAILLVVLPSIVLIMREVTKKDDCRLDQLVLKFSMRAGQRNRRLWGDGMAAYSPIAYRRDWK